MKEERRIENKPLKINDIEMDVSESKSCENIIYNPPVEQIIKRKRALLEENSKKIADVYENQKKVELEYDSLEAQLANKCFKGKFSAEGRKIKLDMLATSMKVRGFIEEIALLFREQSWILEGNNVELLDADDKEGRKRILHELKTITYESLKANERELNNLRMQLANVKCRFFSKKPSHFRLQIEVLTERVEMHRSCFTEAEEDYKVATMGWDRGYSASAINNSQVSVSSLDEPPEEKAE